MKAHHHHTYRTHAQRIADDAAAIRLTIGDAVDDYRRAAASAARHHNIETAAFCADPRTILTGPIEPLSALAWSAISQAYRYLAQARTSTTPQQRASCIEAAGTERRRAKNYRNP